MSIPLEARIRFIVAKKLEDIAGTGFRVANEHFFIATQQFLANNKVDAMYNQKIGDTVSNISVKIDDESLKIIDSLIERFD